MVNDIITGIALKIATLGNTYKVYTSSVKQGLKTPCFIIHLVDVPVGDGISNKKHVGALISITYMPGTDDEDEVRNMMESTINLFSTVSAGSSTVRGYNFKRTISDGCLVTTAEYKYQAEVEGDNDNKMNSLVREGTVK